MGGVAGHMAHLSEDLELTFNEIVSILSKVANAEITGATEKVDGQNLFLTVADGEVRTARNNGDVKKGGMTTDEYISKWRGHPAENAFTNGFKAISAALRKLTPEVLESIFSNGERYVNMEIMYPANPNIISYSAPQIVLHGLQYFGSEALADYSQLSPDEKEELKRQNSLAKQMFPKLARAVDSATQDVANELWTINGPKAVALNKLADGSILGEVTSKIQSFAEPVGMDATLGDYVSLVVRKYTEQVNLPENILEPLLMLMLDPDEAKKVLPEFEGGKGSNAVHKESQLLSEKMQDIAISEGRNVIIPTVGKLDTKIDDLMTKYKKAGYKVTLISMDVSPENVMKRMLQRFIDTGKLIPIKVVKEVEDKPIKTYNKLKGKADGYAKIDNNQEFGQDPTVQEIKSNLLQGQDFRLRQSGSGSDSGIPKQPIKEENLSVDEIPIGERIDPATGEVVSETLTPKQILADIEQDRAMLQRLEGCV